MIVSLVTPVSRNRRTVKLSLTLAPSRARLNTSVSPPDSPAESTAAVFLITTCTTMLSPAVCPCPRVTAAPLDTTMRTTSSVAGLRTLSTRLSAHPLTTPSFIRARTRQ